MIYEYKNILKIILFALYCFNIGGFTRQVQQYKNLPPCHWVDINPVTF